MKQEEIEALAREMAKGVKTEADLDAVSQSTGVWMSGHSLFSHIKNICQFSRRKHLAH